MNEQNPVRWREPGSDVPDAIRDVVGSAALDEVGPDQLSRFVQRAQASVGGPVPSAAARAALSSGKVVAGVALAVGGALLAWMLWGRTPAAAPGARPRAATPAEVQPARPGPAPSDTRPPAATNPTQVEVAAPATANPTQVEVAPATANPTQVEVAAPTTTTNPTQVEVGRAPVDPTQVEVRRVPVAPQSAERTSLSADSLAEEVRLLQGAREALGGDPAGALRLAEQHRSRFPRGTLTQEREVIAIDALIRQGRMAEAQARADRFRDRYPRSSHLDRLSNLRDNRD